MNEMDSVGVGIVEMCITGYLMELWATPFAGCGKAALAFPYAVNGVVHSGIASYAHFHDAFWILAIAKYRCPFSHDVITHIILLT